MEIITTEKGRTNMQIVLLYFHLLQFTVLKSVWSKHIPSNPIMLFLKKKILTQIRKEMLTAVYVSRVGNRRKIGKIWLKCNKITFI